MKRAILAIGLLCGVLAANGAHSITNAPGYVPGSGWVITNWVYVVTNMYTENVITQRLFTHAEHYFTNYYYEVTNIQVSTVQNIYRTNFNYNVIWDNFDPWVQAASNSAVNAQSYADSAALSATQAGNSSSSAYSYSRQAAASASAASGYASDGLSRINERVNWFDTHVIEAIANASGVSNTTVIIDAPGASATYAYMTQRIDNIESAWIDAQGEINGSLSAMSNQVRVATNAVAQLSSQWSDLSSDWSDLQLEWTEFRNTMSNQYVNLTNDWAAFLASFVTMTNELRISIDQRIDTGFTNIAQCVSNDIQTLAADIRNYVDDRVVASTAWSSGTRVSLNITAFKGVSQTKTMGAACLDSPATVNSLVYTMSKAANVDAGTGSSSPSRHCDISAVEWYQGSGNIRLGLRFDYDNGDVVTNWLNTGTSSASTLFKTTAVTRNLSGNNLYGSKTANNSSYGVSGTLVISPHGTY